MKIAAIDIGSNAIRLQIVKAIETKKLVSFKRLQYVRFPLRLGKDVFDKGEILDPTKEKFTKLMTTFRHLIELYEVVGYSTVATSAMREAINGKAIKTYIKKEAGISIDIISGSREAKILYKAIIPYLGKENYLHIDVGGGSTELNFFRGKRLIKSKSFKIGSVRKLTRKERDRTFKEIKEWITDTGLGNLQNIVSIGTGGNIHKLYKIANKGSNIEITLAELRALRAYVNEFSLEDRMSFLKMNPDRADVIIPASEIYIKIMSFIKSDHIMVPQVGLKDGLIYELYEKLSGKDLSEIEFL